MITGPEATLGDDDARPSDARRARARLANLMLGGSDAYDSEWSMMARLQEIAPDVAKLAINDAGFVERAWRFMTSLRGVHQVIYCGAPLPHRSPPHHVAWEASALRDYDHVVYVDPDPLLAAKGRVCLVDHHTIGLIEADPLDVETLFDREELTLRLELDRPVAVIAPRVLDQLDEDQAMSWMAQLRRRLAPGSFLAATHAMTPSGEDGPRLADHLHRTLHYSLVGPGPCFRRAADIADLFQGWQLVSPGVVEAHRWFPDGPPMHETPCDRLLAGLVAVA